MAVLVLWKCQLVSISLPMCFFWSKLAYYLAIWEFVFLASHLGTAVESVHTCTHTHPTHARLTTPHMYKQTYNYTQMSDLETASILRSPEDSVGDRRIVIPLWLHTWEAADFNWKLLKGTTVPGWDTSIETRLRTRAGRSRTSDPSQLSYNSVLEFVVCFDCTSYFSLGANLGV